MFIPRFGEEQEDKFSINCFQVMVMILMYTRISFV